MKNNRLKKFTYNCLVTASQIAFIEKDEKTLSFLEDFSEFFLYITRDLNTVTLFDELSALEKYIVIQKIKYGDRINISFSIIDRFRNHFIHHLTVIDSIDYIVEKHMDRSTGSTEFIIDFDIDVDKCFKVIADTGGSKEVFLRSLA